MENINLTYCITTFNKLNYLKTTLPSLINSLGSDEELIIIDGGSNDGTQAYLNEISKKGNSFKYISEPDKGEAHGYNKALLLAKGKLIKIISDDDAFHYPSIKRCKEYMLSRPEIDVIGSEGLGLNGLLSNIEFNKTSFANQIREWKKNRKPFFFCGLSLMIRKSALPLVGLFHTNFTMIDFEYVARLASGRANIAFYTGFTYANIVNEKSNSVTKSEKMLQEQKKVNLFYFNERSELSKKILFDIAKIYSNVKAVVTSKDASSTNDFGILFSESEKKLIEENKIDAFEFI